MELQFAKCCGNCVHCNRPKQPQDHEPHYMVAKTERWCFKNNLYITRETTCDNFEMEEKKGGVPAIKRVKKFNERATRIMNLINQMKSCGIEELNCYGTIYCIHNNWLYEKTNYKNHWGEPADYFWKIDAKSNNFDRKENLLKETLLNIKKEKGYV